MSDHQESLEQTVKRIEASFAKIKTNGDKVQHYTEKTDQFRISVGKLLVELEARIVGGEAGKSVKWWKWYDEHFKNRSRRDAQKVMRLARSDDPEGALEKEREDRREGMRRLREQDKEEGASHNDDVGRDTQPGSDEDEDNQANWTIDQHADAIRQLVLREIAALEDVVEDIDVLREAVLNELTFALSPPEKEEPPESVKEEAAPPPKRRGRPPKPKSEPTTAGETAGNTGDAEAEAEAQKAKNAALFGDDDLSNPEHPLHRPNQEAA